MTKNLLLNKEALTTYIQKTTNIKVSLSNVKQTVEIINQVLTNGNWLGNSYESFLSAYDNIIKILNNNITMITTVEENLQNNLDEITSADEKSANAWDEDSSTLNSSAFSAEEYNHDSTLSEDQIKFSESLTNAYGLTPKNADLLAKLYQSFLDDNPDNPEKANQMFFAFIGSTSYSTGFQNIAWNLIGDKRSIEYWLNYAEKLGFNKDEISNLRQEILYMHKAQGKDDTSIAVLKNNFGYSNEDIQALFTKPDLAHMAITDATLLNDKKYSLISTGTPLDLLINTLNPLNSIISPNNLGSWVGGLENGTYSVNENAGWVGDIYGAFGASPSCGTDDFKADLDSVNLNSRLETNNNLMEVMPEYYNSNKRVTEFVDNYGGKEEFFKEMDKKDLFFTTSYNHTYNPAASCDEGLKASQNFRDKINSGLEEENY